MPSNQALDVEHLVGLVRALDAASLDPAGGRDLLVGLERLRNAAEAAQARVMVQMLHEARDADAADEAVRGAAPVPTGAREEFVVDEIAVHLRCTKVAASHRFADALAADAHTPLHDGWAWGRLDARKVHVIGDLLLNAEPALAQTLAEAAVEYATSHTGPQLRTWLGRRVMAADPTAAELRRERATAGRHITLVPLPDGVAELSACMPAIQARHIFDTLTAVAHSTDGDDVRTLDQRRSDALYDLVTGRAEPPSVTLNVTVPATTLAGSARQPGELSGFGPLTAEAVGELGLSPVGDVRWRTLLIDPATGILTDVEPRYRPSAQLEHAVRARDRTCRFPGCRRPATTSRSGVDVDHTTPWPAGPTSATNLDCLCRHHHRLKHSPGWRVEIEPDGTLHWTTPTGHRFTTRPWQYDDPPDHLDKAAA